jgi:chemotaxis protein MotB
MARRKKGGGGGGGDGWLVTFSDLMTLLLTFFVLLLSMSSMDNAKLTRISASLDRQAVIAHSGSGCIPDRIIEVVQMIEDPETLLEKRDRIKDLLFPNDILPLELPPGKLEENLRILAHPEGVVIVLNEGILFTAAAYELSPTGGKLLEALLPFLYYTSADVNIAGYTDDGENRPDMSNDELSGRRAMSVLAYFLQNKLPAARFSISGYGPRRPLEPNTSEQGRARNRRVELLVKTVRWVGRYL